MNQKTASGIQPESSPETPLVLSQFLSKVETRPDGLYFTVKREDRSLLDFEQLRQAFSQARIMNADLEKIKDVAARARGGPEKIGEKFRYYDLAKNEYIGVESTPQMAKVTLSPIAEENKVSITREDILFRLQMLGIVHGVIAEAIQRLAGPAGANAPVVVAKALLSVDGKDAMIEEVAQVDASGKPREMATGNVDFKSIETIRQVAQGEIIARRHPPTSGKEGLDIFGGPIPSKPGADIVLSGGKNTQVSEDKLHLIATHGGFLYRENGLVCVGEVLTISGNVDFSSGHVKYLGTVIIKGDVKPDFKVEAEGDITIEGEVEGAMVVSRTGKVEVKKGVLGTGKTRLFAKEELKVAFAQEAVLESDLAVIVEKHLMHCKVKAPRVDVSSRGGIVMGGSLTGYQKILLEEAGSAAGVDTELSIVDPLEENQIKRIKDLEEVEAKVLEALVPVEKKIKTVKTLIRQGMDISDRVKEEVKKTTDEYLVFSKKLEYIRKKKEEISMQQSKGSSFAGEICVNGKLHPQVRLKMYHVTRTVSTLEQGQRYFLADGEMRSQKFQKG